MSRHVEILVFFFVGSRRPIILKFSGHFDKKKGSEQSLVKGHPWELGKAILT